MRIIIFLFFSNILFSQKIFLKCLETKNAIPFSTIVYKINEDILNYDYTNENGYIELNNNIKFDNLEISCLGYENSTIKKESITDTIFLKSKEYLLNEVVISNNRNLQLLGLLNEKEKLEIGLAKGLEICSFFENLEKKELFIQSFIFQLNQKFKERTAVRLHIYESKEGKREPSIELLNENIIHIIEVNHKKDVVIDLSNYDLYLPKEGAFIGIEFLGYYDDNLLAFKNNDYGINYTKVKFNDKEKSILTFIRNSLKKKEWDNTSRLKEELKNKIKFNNTLNASFGLKVLK